MKRVYSSNHSLFFFFNDTATTEIYPLSLHDALPILAVSPALRGPPNLALISRLRLVYSWSPSNASVTHAPPGRAIDRKSTRLNSSHANISYAIFCLKKKIHTLGPSAANVPRRRTLTS